MNYCEETIAMLKDDIECLKQKVKEYRYDYLTGLKGRRDFDYDIRSKFTSCTEFYVCYYDVNGLHRTNREQSFAAGDALIRQVANDIQHQKVAHTTYRTSGDEFYAICCGTPTHEVQNATMVCKNAEDFEDADALLKELDCLMIEAKTKLKTRRMDD